MTRLLAALLLLAAAGASAEPACRDLAHEGRPYTVCTADLATDDLRLFLADPERAPWGTFPRLDAALKERGARLAFAMNAGMFHPDRAPVGLYVEDGREIMRAIPNAGPGNFGMLPNGLLCIRDGRADVLETRAYLADPPACRDATQSGPMLVIDGALHPRFLPDGTSRNIRNGVGTEAGGRVVHFAISNTPVTFHEFGRLFRDLLKTPNALYLDGAVSRLYAPGLGRHDRGFPLGPIVGVITPE